MASTTNIKAEVLNMIAIQEHLHMSAVIEEKLKPCKVLLTKYFELKITLE